jgi:hypothetical protein
VELSNINHRNAWLKIPSGIERNGANPLNYYIPSQYRKINYVSNKIGSAHRQAPGWALGVILAVQTPAMAGPAP